MARNEAEGGIGKYLSWVGPEKVQEGPWTQEPETPAPHPGSSSGPWHLTMAFPQSQDVDPTVLRHTDIHRRYNLVITDITKSSDLVSLLLAPWGFRNPAC